MKLFCVPRRFKISFNVFNKLTKKSNKSTKSNKPEIIPDGPSIVDDRNKDVIYETIKLNAPIKVSKEVSNTIPNNPIGQEDSKKAADVSVEEITVTNNNQVSELRPIEWKDTVPFTFPITGGQVIKVYDGDTITIASKLPYYASPLYRLSVRLNGIDTPEIKGKTEDEKEAAKNARDAVSKLIMQKYVTLKNIQSEKYGRILADVYIGDIHLNQWLIDNHYAVAYDGGTKRTPESWLKYKENCEV
jgi:micrococcal nuclease